MDRCCPEVIKYDMQTGNHGDTERHGDFNLITLRVSVSPWLARILLWLLPLSFLIICFLLSSFTHPRSHLRYLKLSHLKIYYLPTRVLRFHFLPGNPLHSPHSPAGLPSAYLFARYEFRGKSLLRALTAVPFMLPTVVVAAGFNALLGPRGLISISLSSFFFQLHRHIHRHSYRPRFLQHNHHHPRRWQCPLQP